MSRFRGAARCNSDHRVHFYLPLQTVKKSVRQIRRNKKKGSRSTHLSQPPDDVLTTSFGVEVSVSVSSGEDVNGERLGVFLLNQRPMPRCVPDSDYR